jgi:VWFA-related protein
LIFARPGIFLLAYFLSAFAVSPEQPKSTNPPAADKILLDVVVTEKSGPPVPGLQEQDFTLLDNKVPRQITSFRSLDAKVAPIETIVVIDALNASTDEVEFEHQEIDKFLRANGGSLVHPTLIAILNDTDIRRVQDNFSTDGNSLGASLDKYIAASPSPPSSVYHMGEE